MPHLPTFFLAFLIPLLGVRGCEEVYEPVIVKPALPCCKSCCPSTSLLGGCGLFKPKASCLLKDACCRSLCIKQLISNLQKAKFDFLDGLCSLLKKPCLKCCGQYLGCCTKNPCLMCKHHYLVPEIRQVYDEHVKLVPVIRKRLSGRLEKITRHVPLVFNNVENEVEHVVKQVPVVEKRVTPMVCQRTRKVPVIKQRVRHILEDYLDQVPVKENCQKQMEEIVVSQRPVLQTLKRPVMIERLRSVPFHMTRYRPVLEQYIQSVPVKHSILKNLVESKIIAVKEPCRPCNF